MARKKKTAYSVKSLIGLVVLIVFGMYFFGDNQPSKNSNQQHNTQQTIKQSSSEFNNRDNKYNYESDKLSQLNYQGQQIVQINDGKPDFTANELSVKNGAFANYKPLDNLNRATNATGLLSKALMPHEKRQRLTVNPTGFRNKKVVINGKMQWLYNRSHLIGYQFTGQNNNLNNLVTGTRFLNDPSMTHYENMVAMYLRSHPNDYVRYDVTAVYKNNELVPRGIHMRAKSINTNTIAYNIYIFNIQPGVEINYQNGYSTIK